MSSALLCFSSGSISYLKATELHVLVMSTNQNLCVRYSFKDTLPMRSPSGDKVSVCVTFNNEVMSVYQDNRNIFMKLGGNVRGYTWFLHFCVSVK